MFRDLYAVARHTPLTLIITPRGEQLGVIVMPKPTGEAASNQALAKPFSIVGTPEELDTEFTAALAKYSGSVTELRTALDLPLDELEAAKKKAVKKDAAKADKEKQKADEAKNRSEAAKKAAATRATKLEEKRKAKEAAKRKRADARAAQKASRAQRSIKLPGATGELPKPAAAAKPAATSEPAAARHLASKPGKAECIADYLALQAKVKEPLTRRGFIKRAQTGRRYEKLWDSWTAFVAEAKDAPASAAEPKPGTEVVVPPLKTVDDWPFPTDKSIARAQEQAKQHENSGAAPGQSAESSSSSSTTAAEPAAPEPRFEVRTEDGELLYTYQSQPEIGERLEIPGRPDVRYRVLEVDGHQVTAREVLLSRMKILDPEGIDLQVDTDQVYSIGDRVTELETGDWRIVVATGAYYMARRTDKPRVKGPAATAAPATEGAATA